MYVAEKHRELIQTVLDDILYFRQTWTDQCNPVTVRQGSVMLRRLLLDGHYLQAWFRVGLTGHPNIAAPFINDLVGDEAVWWALAGGATCKGFSMQRYVGRFTGNGTVTVGGEASIFGRPFLVSTKRGIEPIPVKDYLISLSAILDATAITRRDVIAFMANKAGGVHLDGKDDSPAMKALRKRRGFLGIGDHDALSFEILSIGQCLAWSPETDQFIQHACSILGLPLADGEQ